MDKMREEFDEWIAKHMPDYELEYSGWVEAMFDAWQASRAALAVELHKPQYGVDYGYEIHEVKEMLAGIGVKYK